MERSFKILVAFSVLLVLCLAFAGCSDTTDSGSSTTETTAPAVSAQYAAGDIVWTTSSTSIGWLILTYDPATDLYTRATIHKNPDGSWGYRTDGKTETAKRSAVEKVNIALVKHVDIAAVPTKAPTTVPTTTVTTRVTTATTTTGTTTTTTTTSVLLPIITKIEPEEGTAGESVTIDITGSNFDKNATARLQHSGEDSIDASSVAWTSSTKLTATFAIPNSTLIGAWDVVVTNSGSKSGSLKNYFLVHGNTDE